MNNLKTYWRYHKCKICNKRIYMPIPGVALDFSRSREEMQMILDIQYETLKKEYDNRLHIRCRREQFGK